MATPIQIARLKSVVATAQVCAMKYGVLASITLAQWIIESSWGTSKLATTANNFFGIKSSHQAAPGTYVEMPTAEYEAGQRTMVTALFAKYPTVAAGFEAHAALLAHGPRYQRVMETNDPAVFAEGLQECGYSTNPNYAAELMQLVRDYNLTQYDTPPPAEPMAQEIAA